MLSADLAVDNSWCCRLHLLLKLHAAAIISIDFAQTDIWSHQVLGAQTLHWIPLWTMVWATSFTNKTQTRNPYGCQPFLIYPIPALFPSLTCLSFTVALLCPASRYHPRISFIKKSPYLDTAHFLHLASSTPDACILLTHLNANFRPLLSNSCAKVFPLGGTWLPPSKASLATCRHPSHFSHRLSGF